MLAAEEALVSPGAGSDVAVGMELAPAGRAPDLAIAEHGRRDAEDWRAVLECLKNPGPQAPTTWRSDAEAPRNGSVCYLFAT